VRIGLAAVSEWRLLKLESLFPIFWQNGVIWRQVTVPLKTFETPGPRFLGPLLFMKTYRERDCVSSGPVPRIFVVDNEEVIASTLAAILNMSGFSARFFTRPIEVLAAIQADIPDLVITEVAMPDLTGIDLAIRMREKHPECKILLFSGQADTVDLVEDAGRRGHDFHLLKKPLHPSELVSRVIEKLGEPAQSRMYLVKDFEG
jgi:CheY-like chemotaxis protein